MADIVVQWQGLTLGGDASPYYVQTITGWDDLPDIKSYDTPRSRGHGDHAGNQFSGPRTVTVEGTIADPIARNDLALALSARTTIRSDDTDLSVTTFGRSFTAGAVLARSSIPVGERYAAGIVPFALQWKCRDPLRYGTTQTTSTGLPSPGTGMAFPMAFPMDFGTAGTPGQITLTNDGTADAPVVFTVTGPLIGGFEISGGGQRLTYPVDVSAGEVLTVDTGVGTVVTSGTADRRANLTNADWLQVPAVGSLTVQFTALGAYDPAALLSASWRSASW